MHTYQTDSQKNADGAPSELPTDTLRLGVDEAGSTHYFSRIADTVVVVDTDGTVEQQQELGDRDTSAYPRLPVSDECSDALSEPRSEQAGVERTA
jgi:hypothetical protein